MLQGRMASEPNSRSTPVWRVQAIDEIDEKREQKADPSQIVAQQRRQQTALLPLGQFER